MALSRQRRRPVRPCPLSPVKLHPALLRLRRLRRQVPSRRLILPRRCLVERMSERRVERRTSRRLENQCGAAQERSQDQHGPATTGNNTPGGSPGANQPAPPRGASQPYTAQTAPKGSLGDQTRTAAFDPTGTVMPGDPTDSRNVFAVDTTGRSRRQQERRRRSTPTRDIHTTMQGAMSEAPKNGRAPVPRRRCRITSGVPVRSMQAHNQGGKLGPGDALLVGMVGRYKELLRQGRQKEASVAAWGLIQAANLEAATRGRTSFSIKSVQATVMEH